MRKVLMVTSGFPPPKNTGRKIRMALRAKMLLEYDWKTVVLTKGYSSKSYTYDVGRDKVKIYQCFRRMAFPVLKQRFGMLSPFFPPDPFLLQYIVSMYSMGLEIVGKEGIDVIYTMNNPRNLHLIGFLLKKKTGLPWITEFRDPWARHPSHHKGKVSFYARTRDMFLEKMIVRSSDKVVLCEGIPIENDYFHKTYSYLPENRFDMLPYVGFDREEFEDIHPRKFNEFTITYAGTFYGQGLNPKNFLLGLHLFKEKYGLSCEDIRVNFLGDWRTEYSSIVKHLQMDSVVRSYGWMPHKRCLEFLMGSDLLLLIVRKLRGYEFSVPLKVWDYIGAKKPILALVPTRWKAAKFIQSNKLGISVDPNSPEKIAETLEKIYYSKDKGTSLFSPSERFLRSLDANRAEVKFCRLLNELVDQEHGYLDSQQSIVNII